MTISFVMFGPPGAGKGTQAQKLAKHFSIPHISTGDMLRQVKASGSPLGQEVSEIMRRGELVPAELVIKIVNERLQEADCDHGFILDGFPRTVPQAVALNDILLNQRKQLSAVVNLEVTEWELVGRLSGRRTCPRCARAYHVLFSPPKQEGYCDDCDGVALITREDDREETVRERLNVYRSQTEPLIHYYRDRYVLQSIDGEQDPETVFKDIVALFEADAS